MKILQSVILFVVTGTSFAISQPMIPTGETSTFTAGGERIPLPGLSITLEPDSCIRFYWKQYVNTYNDLTLEQAEQKAEEMITDRFTSTNCYVPMTELTRVETINQVTQSLMERNFRVTFEDGDQVTLWQFWYRKEDNENLNIFYYYGSEDNVLIVVNEETLLAKKRSQLEEYLIEVVTEVDLKLLLGDESTAFEKDCTENYSLENQSYDAKPLYKLESCEITVVWQDSGEYYVTATLRESKIGDLMYSTNSDNF